MKITIELNEDFTLYEWDQCKNAIDKELFKKLSKKNTRKEQEFNTNVVTGHHELNGYYNIFGEDNVMYKINFSKP